MSGLCVMPAGSKRWWVNLRTSESTGTPYCSATLIAVNWVVYVWAIQQNEVYAASLGYYINPLVNVLFVFRGDKRCLHDLAAKTMVVRC